MNEYPTMGGEGVTSARARDRLKVALPPLPESVYPPNATPLPHQTEYVTTQTLAPYLIGLLRAVYLGVFGAASGLSIGLAMGSRDWSDLLWGALIGFLGGFLGRTAEAVIIDEPKSNSVTEKV